MWEGGGKVADGGGQVETRAGVRGGGRGARWWEGWRQRG